MADCLDDWDDADQKPCSEFERRQFEASIDGYRDGVVNGKEKSLQSGFNEAFSRSSRLAFDLRRWGGIASAMLACGCASNGELRQLCEEVLRCLDSLKLMDTVYTHKCSSSSSDPKTHECHHLNDHSPGTFPVASADSLKPVTEKLSLLTFHSWSDLLEWIQPDCRDTVVSLMDSISRVIEQIQ